MALIYFDSSALVKLLVQEEGSDREVGQRGGISQTQPPDDCSQRSAPTRRPLQLTVAGGRTTIMMTAT
jgi:hypothetical protein